MRRRVFAMIPISISFRTAKTAVETAIPHKRSIARKRRGRASRTALRAQKEPGDCPPG